MVSTHRMSALALLLLLALGAGAVPLSLERLSAHAGNGSGSLPPAASLASKKADLKGPQACQDCKKPFDPKRDPVDMVFTWVNYSNSVYSEAVGKACGSKNPGVSGDQSNSFIELKYALRSLQKNGLMKQLRKIFVVMSDSHPPPSWLKPKPGKLEVVTHSALMKNSKFGVNAPIVASLNSIMSVIHYIPGLSNWFIYSGDDQFLMRPFAWGSVDLYDLKEAKVISHLNQGINTAANDSWYGAAAHTASLLDGKFGGKPRSMDGYHCPVFVNKCLLKLARKFWPEELKATAANYCGLKPKVVQWETLYGNLASECGVGRPTANMSSFTDELHTNRFGTDEAAAKDLKATLSRYAAGQHQWVNLQGDGISDEYPKNAMVHDVAYGWLEQQFPSPTPYEKTKQLKSNGSQLQSTRGSSKQKQKK